jgi:hypothetical protein
LRLIKYARGRARARREQEEGEAGGEKQKKNIIIFPQSTRGEKNLIKYQIGN